MRLSCQTIHEWMPGVCTLLTLFGLEPIRELVVRLAE